MKTWNLPDDRYFDPDPTQKHIALELYAAIAGLPIVSPHGHVDPRLFADPQSGFGTPTDLLILPDHYVFRMLHSQGVPLDQLGISRRDGGPTALDPRNIWQRFADLFYLFRGTPSGMWLAYEFKFILGIDEQLTPENAQFLYDAVAERLTSAEFQPRRAFERFNIEVLSTTDAASDPLIAHAAIHASGWNGRILPTFRPDAVIQLDSPEWPQDIQALSQASGMEVRSYSSFLQALQNRRAFFKSMGAVATDHGTLQPQTQPLNETQAAEIFERALLGRLAPDDSARFNAHMLFEMARMSTEDGLVMQIHAGSLRGHNPNILAQFGRDKGYDIPVQTEATRSLQPLLAHFGEDPRLSLILFTLDETSYSRELAPLAGVYPAVKLGPPWWFHDSWNGMRRYFDQVMETAGIYNTAGFNDDTRAFLSIPARHDLWRRASANWLAGLTVRGVLGLDEAREMAADLAYRLPKKAYHLD